MATHLDCEALEMQNCAHHLRNILPLKQIDRLERIRGAQPVPFCGVEKTPNVLHLVKRHLAAVDACNAVWGQPVHCLAQHNAAVQRITQVAIGACKST